MAIKAIKKRKLNRKALKPKAISRFRSEYEMEKALIERLLINCVPDSVPDAFKWESLSLVIRTLLKDGIAYYRFHMHTNAAGFKSVSHFKRVISVLKKEWKNTVEVRFLMHACCNRGVTVQFREV